MKLTAALQLHKAEYKGNTIDVYLSLFSFDYVYLIIIVGILSNSTDVNGYSKVYALSIENNLFDGGNKTKTEKKKKIVQF